MTTPLTENLPVGYVPAEDVYITYTEYYGDGTIYGRRNISLPSGELIQGAGKCVRDLINLGAVVPEECMPAVGGALIQVHLENTPEWIPLTEGYPVGYVPAEDVYIVFSEYYGGGTIYGRRALKLPNDEPVKGVGKSVRELIQLGVLLHDQVLGSTGGDLVRVPIDIEVVHLEMNVAYLAKEDKYVKYDSFTNKTLVGARYLTLRDGRRVNSKGRTMKNCHLLEQSKCVSI